MVGAFVCGCFHVIRAVSRPRLHRRPRVSVRRRDEARSYRTDSEPIRRANPHLQLRFVRSRNAAYCMGRRTIGLSGRHGQATATIMKTRPIVWPSPQHGSASFRPNRLVQNPGLTDKNTRRGSSCSLVEIMRRVDRNDQEIERQPNERPKPASASVRGQ
jgi:hypothetical protein